MQSAGELSDSQNRNSNNGISRNMSSKGNQAYVTGKKQYSKDCTVRIEGIQTQNVKNITVIESIEEVTGLNTVLAVVQNDALSYDVTLDSKEDAVKLLNGIEINRCDYNCSLIFSDTTVVSFMKLPSFIEDDEIRDKLRQKGILIKSPIYRRAIPGTQVADGTRFVKCKFPPGFVALPWTMGFEIGTTMKYYRVVHNNQTKVCSLCLSPDHIQRDCPHYVCDGCGNHGHSVRKCRAKKCDGCKNLPLKCVCEAVDVNGNSNGGNKDEVHVGANDFFDKDDRQGFGRPPKKDTNNQGHENDCPYCGHLVCICECTSCGNAECTCPCGKCEKFPCQCSNVCYHCNNDPCVCPCPDCKHAPCECVCEKCKQTVCNCINSDENEDTEVAFKNDETVENINEPMNEQNELCKNDVSLNVVIENHNTENVDSRKRKIVISDENCNDDNVEAVCQTEMNDVISLCEVNDTGRDEHIDNKKVRREASPSGEKMDTGGEDSDTCGDYASGCDEVTAGVENVDSSVCDGDESSDGGGFVKNNEIEVISKNTKALTAKQLRRVRKKARRNERVKSKLDGKHDAGKKASDT